MTPNQSKRSRVHVGTELWQHQTQKLKVVLVFISDYYDSYKLSFFSLSTYIYDTQRGRSATFDSYLIVVNMNDTSLKIKIVIKSPSYNNQNCHYKRLQDESC